MPGEPAHGAQRAPVRRHLPRAGPRRFGGYYLQPVPALEYVHARNAFGFTCITSRAKAGLNTAGRPEHNRPMHTIAMYCRQIATTECALHVQ